MCISNELQREKEDPPPFPTGGGDDEGLTESLFTLISEDTNEMAAISCTEGEQRLFSCSASTARDKCLTEGHSPSSGI